MKRRYKLKINGESPRSLLLAFVLAKLRCDIYIYNFILNSNSNKNDQLFLFSNSSKNLLSKINIWDEIEDITYGFNSLAIKDNLLKEELLLRTKNISEKYFNNIGWTAKYSDLKRLLINKLIKNKNVHFISKNQIIDKPINFDFEFNFKNHENTKKRFKSALSTITSQDEKILIFNVYLRGHAEKRFYEINTIEGLLILTPLNKNLYQIIWKNASSRIKENSINSKSFFLDNLTTLLPNELKIDQIIGDINFLNLSNIGSSYLIKNNSFCVNENKFESNTIFNFDFDLIIKTILNIYNFLENNESKNIQIFNKLGFNCLFKKYIEIILNFSLTNYFFNLFIVNNIFSLLIRKLLFIIFKRINLIKYFFMRNLYNSNIYNLIK